uniref:Uncharacterized protein n=1 Tax=viral metagenome TaxID=1070528 RepID=A0A6M3LLN6_9ZZZZ
MQKVFQNALYHQEPTVLLRRLLPLCLGHLHQLYAAESCYVNGGAKHLFDLVFAVGICSRTWEEGIAWLHSPTLLRSVKRWGRESSRTLNFFEEERKFAVYFDEYSQLPYRRIKEGPEAGRPYKHPWTLILATELLDKVGESRAWNMPLPLALSYWSGWQEIAHGDDTLNSEQDDRNLKMQQEYMAEQKRKAEMKAVA